MESFKLTVVVENSTDYPGWLAEHGLSYLIERDDETLLFDCGQGPAFRHNFEKLKIKQLDRLVLSHGHYDHVGNLSWLLKRFPALKIHAHPTAFAPKFSASQGHLRPIGIPPVLAESVQHLPNFAAVEGFTELLPGLYATGPIPRQEALEGATRNLFADKVGTVDPLTDDQALVVQLNDGLLVILGCAHAGVINTLAYIQSHFPYEPIIGVIGGMHLKMADEARLAATAACLAKSVKKWVAPCHCSGWEAFYYLRENCRSLNVRRVMAGTQMNFTTGGNRC